jgi:hypothetical protein
MIKLKILVFNKWSPTRTFSGFLVTSDLNVILFAQGPRFFSRKQKTLCKHFLIYLTEDMADSCQQQLKSCSSLRMTNYFREKIGSDLRGSNSLKSNAYCGITAKRISGHIIIKPICMCSGANCAAATY